MTVSTLPLVFRGDHPAGWKTPTFIAVLYCLGNNIPFSIRDSSGFRVVLLLLAVAHFAFFRWLNNQQVDYIHVISQSYVSTISTGLVNAFRSCLVASSLHSSTQILWQLLREKPLKISTIDYLFSIGSDPLKFYIFLHAPVL